MRNLILVIIATLGVIAGGIFLYQEGKTPSISTETATEATAETKTTAAVTEKQQTGSVDIFHYENDSKDYSFAHATTERYIGSLDAPVVFYDFSSLSCPHCATFHTDVLSKIKSNFIENGLVRIVFKPMPLNPSALMGEQLARCIPKKDYYKTISLLYANQKVWAYSENPRSSLTNIVKLSGISKEKVDECLNAKDLEAALVKATQDNAQEFKITSTPSFVFKLDGRLVKGAQSYEYFEALLNSYIKKANNINK